MFSTFRPAETLRVIPSQRRSVGVGIHSPGGQVLVCMVQNPARPGGEVDCHARLRRARNDEQVGGKVERGGYRTNRDVSGDRKGRPYCFCVVRCIVQTAGEKLFRLRFAPLKMTSREGSMAPSLRELSPARSAGD